MEEGWKMEKVLLKMREKKRKDKDYITPNNFNRQKLDKFFFQQILKKRKKA